MIGLFERMGWAVEARGLSPPAKLVLILVADAAGADCRSRIDGLAEKANLTDAGLSGALAELMDVGLVAKPVINGAQVVELLIEGRGVE
jgi:hypothetical protein